jgi:subtilisin
VQKRTLVLLLMGLLGCGPTDGPPVSGTVYPFPRRATWNEEVRVSLPWRAGSSLSARLAGVPLEILRLEPDPAGGSGVVFKVPDNFWGGPQALELREGENQASGSLTVLGQTVFEQPEPEALALIRPGVSDVHFAQTLAGAGLRLVPIAPGVNSVSLGGASGPCAGRLARVARDPAGPAPLAAGALLEHLERAAGGLVVDLDGVLGIDPITGYDVDPGPDPSTRPINARSAVKLRPGSNFTGAGITIAVVDTGVKNLSGLTLKSGGADFVGTPPNPLQDEYTQGGVVVGHGTAAAVLAAHATYGIAPGAGILPIKSCDKDGKCRLEAVIRGICHAVAYAEQHPQERLVLSLSLGSDTPSEIVYIILKDALMRRKANGIPVVAAAGNQWALRSSKRGVLHHFPASFGGNRGLSVRREPERSMTVLKGLFSVGAVGDYSGTFRVSAFSGQGDFVDLVAPGERVLSLSPAGSLGEYTGTSFAAPIVSGAVAVIRQATSLVPLTPEALELTFLANYTDPTTPGAPEEAQGRGLLDLTRGP